MRQGTLLYLAMLLLLGGGFEGIRRVGSTLTPPRHIAGLWRFTLSSSPGLCPILAGKPPGEGTLQVEQSGRYLRLIFSDTPPTRLRANFTDNTLLGSGPSPHACAMDAKVEVSGHLTDNRLNLILTRAPQPPEALITTLSLSAIRTPDGATYAPTPPLEPGSNTTE